MEEIPKNLRFSEELTFGPYQGHTIADLYWGNDQGTRPDAVHDPIYVEMLVDIGALVMTPGDHINIRKAADKFREKELNVRITDREAYLEP